MSAILKPCLSCGEPTDAGSYCNDCQPKRAPRPPRASRAAGYDTAWDKLSKRGRRLQPWCSDCGATANLSCGHSPEAWRRHDAGLPIRLQDVDVVCVRCNNRRGFGQGSVWVLPSTGPNGPNGLNGSDKAKYSPDSGPNGGPFGTGGLNGVTRENTDSQPHSGHSGHSGHESEPYDANGEPADPCPQCGYSLTLRAGTQRCAWQHKQAQAEAKKEAGREG